jgi:enoyl-CoA hydratase/3-hydroxyacyl-CoA dehydrogenase
MAFSFRGLKLEKVAVVGSGQIGPDIALYFAKVFAPYRVQVVVVDVAEEALKKGRAKLEKKIQKGVETGAFARDFAAAMSESVLFTSDYEKVRGAGLVIEAASENLDIKRKIFSRLEELCPPQAVLASNSSHLQPEVIFEQLKYPGRALVIHYFFPAERNPMIEIVPGARTDGRLVDTLMEIYEHIGKVPIRVGSRYGYAIDPIFEGLFLASALCVEEGLGTVKEVDSLAGEALGLAVGSFTAMNLTGGNPLTNHGLEMEGKYLNRWYRSPKLMQDAVASGKPWEVAARGEKVEVPHQRAEKIVAALRGAYFGLVGQIIDSGIVDPSDFEMGLEIALDIRPPLKMMNEMGIGEALKLVEAYAAGHPEFPVPECLRRQAASGKPWPIHHVLRRDRDGVAVLCIRRPKVLNALNQEVFDELAACFQGIEKDPSVRAAVLTGFGTKAFVSGADINFLANLKTPEEAFRETQRSKRAGLVIEGMKKPVVCALNGFALGGGLELAMCCSEILVTKGLDMAAGQPEVNLGIIPGAGGTQRLPRWIGIEQAARMLRTGKPISGNQGLELGLFSEEVERERLLERAVEVAQELAAGKRKPRRPSPAPFKTPDRLPDLDIGHLSRAIDAILCRAIIEGCRLPLAAGLELESRLFGECLKTEDMRIGIENFLKNGPRAKAQFVHR